MQPAPWRDPELAAMPMQQQNLGTMFLRHLRIAGEGLLQLLGGRWQLRRWAAVQLNIGNV